MGEAKLNRKLNIVLTVEGAQGDNVYIHSVPISLSVFEEHYLPISRTFTSIYTNNLGPVTGPRVAKYILMQQADEVGQKEKVEKSLMPEIHRLTNGIVSGQNGWETLPFGELLKRGVLDAEGVAEVENVIVYFMCASSIRLRAEIILTLDGLRALWGAQTTSLNVTEYMRSLPTSTTEESTGENVTPLPEKPRLSIPG